MSSGIGGYLYFENQKQSDTNKKHDATSTKPSKKCVNGGQDPLGCFVKGQDPGGGCAARQDSRCCSGGTCDSGGGGGCDSGLGSPPGRRETRCCSGYCSGGTCDHVS